jgi:D-beta-D-heptose 7-phosphate kinase/D-beta-D-heptose 1-phosphate adenosyltransferase
MKKVFSTSEWRELVHLRKKWQKDGDTLVFTNGCFDGLHPGHLALLDHARKQGGKVVVGLNTDRSVHELKGKGRPRYPGKERARDILNSGGADAVVFFDEATPAKIIARLHPEVLIKGSDYRMEDIVGAGEVKKSGGKVLIFPRVDGFSSSRMLIRDAKTINKTVKS